MNSQNQIDLLLQLELAGKQITVMSEEVHALTDTQPYTGEQRRPDHYVFPKNILPEIKGVIPSIGTEEEYQQIFEKYGADGVFVTFGQMKKP